MHVHGSMLLYVHRNQEAHWPRTATSTFRQLLRSDKMQLRRAPLYVYEGGHVGSRNQKRGRTAHKWRSNLAFSLVTRRDPPDSEQLLGEHCSSHCFPFRDLQLPS